MTTITQTTERIPEVPGLRPEQQEGRHCALCGRYLGAWARKLGGEQEWHGYVFQLWACSPQCPPRPISRRPPSGGHP